MARNSRRHRSRRRNRSLSGGSYSSAATYQQYVNGSPNEQYGRVFDQAGSFGEVPGNTLIGAQGQNVTSPTHVPNAAQLDLVQKAGKRKHRKGGFLGETVNQAIVPLALLGMQNTYRRKKGGKRTRRRRRH